jgi:hypothetical protein
MFGKIRSAFRSMAGLKKKVEYNLEKQIALTFYADIGLIFSFDKEMSALCKEMNSLISSDVRYSNLEKCESVNNKIKMRLNFLEHSRTAQKFLSVKRSLIDNLERAMKKYVHGTPESQESP